MAPTRPLLTLLQRDFDPGAPAASFRDEWSTPSNYAFTILLLIGGDLVNRALAQLVGGWLTPVAFSFGGYFFLAYKHTYLIGVRLRIQDGSHMQRPPSAPR